MAEEVMKTPPSPTERENKAEEEELEGFEGMDALARTMEACEPELNCSLPFISSSSYVPFSSSSSSPANTNQATRHSGQRLLCPQGQQQREHDHLLGGQVRAAWVTWFSILAFG